MIMRVALELPKITTTTTFFILESDITANVYRMWRCHYLTQLTTFSIYVKTKKEYYFLKHSLHTYISE